MNNLKVFVFMVFFAVLALPVLAEPNHDDHVQQPIMDPCQTIRAAPKPVTLPQPQLQPETTTTEQIIEKAHQYYNSELNKALVVISILVTLLVVVFILVGFLFEWQRNKSFQQQLDKREEQLQKYFDNRLVEEIKTLKENAQKQLDEVIRDVRADLLQIYGNLAAIYSRFYARDKKSETLCFLGYLNLSACSMCIYLKYYKRAALSLNTVKESLPDIKEKDIFKVIHIGTIIVSKLVKKANNDKLQKVFDEFNEAFIVKKHELGYTGQLEDKQ